MAVHPDELFSDAAIRNLAEDANLPPSADLSLFGEFVRTAAKFYLEEAGWASAAQIRADIAAIRRTVKPLDERKKAREPKRIISALEKGPPATLRELKTRAEVRGERFPTVADIRDPTRINDAARILDMLTRAGGYVRQGRKRPSGKRSKEYVVELYAPVSPKNFAKREAERAATKRLRAAWRWAAAQGNPGAERAIPCNKPSKSASRENPGPFVRLTHGFFSALGVNADAVHLINSIDFDELQEPSHQDLLAGNVIDQMVKVLRPRSV